MANVKIYFEPGGEKLVVEDGAEIEIAGASGISIGGDPVAHGAQAAFQADLAVDADGAAIAAAVNGLRDALIAFGIMASQG